MMDAERETTTIEEVARAGWVYVGTGYFCPGYESTVDAFNLDGHELRAYPRGEGPPRCEVTERDSSGNPTSLWVEGVPDAALAGRLMEEHGYILISSCLGIGEYVLDLIAGEVIPEREACRRYPDNGASS